MPGGIKLVYKTLGLGLLVFAAGCAGTRDTHQFDPIPSANIYSSELNPTHTARGDYAPLEFPSPLPARVEYEIQDIQTRYPKNFQTGLDRAQQYLPYIYDAFAREGLPQELAWIAMVESQFHPKAVSRAGASGMWQFMGPAGQRFGLRMDTYVDERFNWKRQTYAAAEYFKTLYDFFDGDWALALSAYNMGEGGLSRTINAHGGERDFWKLVEVAASKNTLREETQKYYPRLLATALVAKNPEKYGFKINQAPADDSIDIQVEGMYALDDLDEAMGYPHGTLATLNPGLVQGVTPPNGAYAVYVPRQDREEFMLALNNAPKMNYGSGTHKVNRGETISQIARKYGVSQTELMNLNGVKSARSLRVGQSLRIPGQLVTSPASVSISKTPTVETLASTAPQTQQSTYTVKKGDTLSTIATRYGIRSSDIQQWNSMGKSTRLDIGNKLKITSTTPALVTASAPTENAPAPNATYTVQKGDTLSSIASKRGVKVATLQSWNNLGNSINIKIGQQLKVYDSGTTPEAAPQEMVVASAPQYHTVKSGEFPAAIARAYNLPLTQLLELNKLDKSAVLHIGDKLIVGGAPTKAVDSPQIQIAIQPVETSATLAPEPSSKKITHTVAKGDTPSGIARKYGVSLRDLLAWNNLSPKSVIKLDQKLAVYPATRAAASEAESDTPQPQVITHVVEKGQTPWTIARHYNVKLDHLQQWNQWKTNHVLQIGEKVTVQVKK